VTPLDKTLKRAIMIKGQEYVITLSPEAVKISRKGHRLGAELKWADLISGDSALAVALHASIGRFEEPVARFEEPVAVGPKKSRVVPEDRPSPKRPPVRKNPPRRRKRR
jgi:hypothetical protein